jgi:Ran-binding protein 1
MSLQPNIGSDRSWVWKTLADMAEGAPTAETLAIRFANSESEWRLFRDTSQR